MDRHTEQLREGEGESERWILTVHKVRKKVSLFM